MQIKRFLSDPTKWVGALMLLATVMALGYWPVSPSLFQARLRQPPESLLGTLWPEPRPLSAFMLKDAQQRPFEIARLHGRWSFVFFGYTNCPDVCPTTLAVLKGVAARLEQESPLHEKAQFVFVSLDPQRDSLEHLGRYVAYFNKDIVGTTGNAEQIAGFADGGLGFSSVLLARTDSVAGGCSWK